MVDNEHRLTLDITDFDKQYFDFKYEVEREIDTSNL